MSARISLVISNRRFTVIGSQTGKAENSSVSRVMHSLRGRDFPRCLASQIAVRSCQIPRGRLGPRVSSVMHWGASLPVVGRDLL
jgi:hypothetical protein